MLWIRFSSNLLGALTPVCLFDPNHFLGEHGFWIQLLLLLLILLQLDESGIFLLLAIPAV
jgi:hypothetical protein